MAKFLTDLKAECVTDDKWRLVSPLVYESDIIGVVKIPSGFTTNFASVPRLPFVYMLFGDTAHQAATLHDYLYQFAVVPRHIADKVFLEAMQASGIGWERYPMFWGVRLCGGLFYA